MHMDTAARQHNPAFWTTAERLHEVFNQLEHQMSSSPRGLAVLRQVQALEAELEAEVMHRSRRIAAA
ncbi:hypothetical protein GETHOR_09530 [Geothrix oryzae]|uniref:Uncharacterized protein n=1 Tax=Geothrix oryzae TaxID=2927975 RepID=A0ABM8DPI3_9BACT|nr:MULTISPECIES: hypothetical protein [Geothrix]BDU68852.1 hypothetical protein GETHOR_09530 [Geothrix oryzae]